MSSELDLQERLREHFREVAETPTVVGKGPALAATNGRQWKNQRRLGAGAVVVAVTALVGLGMANGFGFATPDVPVADSGEDSAEDVAAAVEVATVDWGASSQGGLSGYQTSLVAGADGLYALSTAPGIGFDVPEQPKHFYRSDDGLHWESLGQLALGGDLSASKLTAYGNRLYVVGTAPSTQANGRQNVFVGSSDADVASWDVTTLDTGWGEEPLPIEYSAVNPAMAVLEDTIVVAATSNASYDISGLIPDEFANGQNVGWDVSERGIRVLEWSETDEAETVVWESTWDDLGVDGANSNRTAVWVSMNGGGFEPVVAPEVDDQTWNLDLAAGTDGFLLAASGERLQVWSSQDGRVWESLGQVPGANWTQALGEVGGRSVAVTDGNTGTQVHVFSDGGWDKVELPAGQNAWASAATIDGGRLGLVLTEDGGEGNDPLAARLITTSDLENWTETPILRFLPNQWFEKVAFLGDRVWLAGAGSQGNEGPARMINMVGTIAGE